MKFYVTKTSDWNYKEKVSFDTLEELLEFVNKNDDIVIFAKYHGYKIPPDCECELEIYDTYRE